MALLKRAPQVLSPALQYTPIDLLTTLFVSFPPFFFPLDLSLTVLASTMSGRFVRSSKYRKYPESALTLRLTVLPHRPRFRAANTKGTADRLHVERLHVDGDCRNNATITSASREMPGTPTWSRFACLPSHRRFVQS